MTALRSLTVAVLLLLAVALQAGPLRHLSLAGVVPNLVLLVVVAAALVRGPEYGACLGLFAGLLVDLAPPADHVAGRWALALVLVGYLVGRTRPDTRPSPLAAVLVVAAGSFVANSVFALSGIALSGVALSGLGLSDVVPQWESVGGVSVGEALEVIPIAVGYDVLVTPLVLPAVLYLLRRLQPVQVQY